MKNKTIFEEPEDLNDFEEATSESVMESESEDEVTSLEKEEILHQDTKKFNLDKELDETKSNTKSIGKSESKSEFEQARESWNEQKVKEAKEKTKINQELQDIPKRKRKPKRQEDEFDFSEEKHKESKHPLIFGFLKLIVRLIIYIALVCGITYLVLHYVAQRTVVDGSSMESTLHDKDNLIIDKLTYRFEKPKRFDIIVFPYQTGKKVYYIKRIIGLPGETVRIDAQGNIFINEEELQESYGMEVMKDPGLAVNGITLGKDEYFVLGDNRNDSTDSRSEKVGLVKGSDIIGKAFIRVFPFQKISLLDDKE